MKTAIKKPKMYLKSLILSEILKVLDNPKDINDWYYSVKVDNGRTWVTICRGDVNVTQSSRREFKPTTIRTFTNLIKKSIDIIIKDDWRKHE